MKKRNIVVGALFIYFLVIGALVNAEEAPRKVIELANSKLVDLGESPEIIAAVNTQNAKFISLNRIKEMDETWKKTPGIANYMQTLMDSDCGKYLRKIQKSAPFYSEIFVMDNQGANVAMTDKTSDYWQGDEAKFKKSFNGGKGAVFVDEVEFDDSAQAYLVQISVPVKDNGKVIGAITFGIDVDRIE